MLKKILNRKGQNTAEYAILISLVVAGIIAMQTYAQRAFQARVRDGSQFMVDETSLDGIEGTDQYEPYYMDKDITVDVDGTVTKEVSGDTASVDELTTVTRDGDTISTYDGPTEK